MNCQHYKNIAASDLAERERPAKLKAARKYNGNLSKFRWASYQLFGRPDKGPMVSCDDSCSLYTAPPFRFDYVIRDDFLLNDTQVYSGAVVSTIDASASEEPLKPFRTVRSGCQPRHDGCSLPTAAHRTTVGLPRFLHLLLKRRRMVSQCVFL